MTDKRAKDLADWVGLEGPPSRHEVSAALRPGNLSFLELPQYLDCRRDNHEEQSYSWARACRLLGYQTE